MDIQQVRFCRESVLLKYHIRTVLPQYLTEVRIVQKVRLLSCLAFASISLRCCWCSKPSASAEATKSIVLRGLHALVFIVSTVTPCGTRSDLGMNMQLSSQQSTLCKHDQRMSCSVIRLIKSCKEVNKVLNSSGQRYTLGVHMRPLYIHQPHLFECCSALQDDG